jgi:hypothetical protein
VIVAPGVLLDVAAKDGVNSLEPDRVVTAANLACCERQGLVVEPGTWRSCGYATPASGTTRSATSPGRGWTGARRGDCPGWACSR